jgi:hypothetical protein
MEQLLAVLASTGADSLFVLVLHDTDPFVPSTTKL